MIRARINAILICALALSVTLAYQGCGQMMSSGPHHLEASGDSSGEYPRLGGEPYTGKDTVPYFYRHEGSLSTVSRLPAEGTVFSLSGETLRCEANAAPETISLIFSGLRFHSRLACTAAEAPASGVDYRPYNSDLAMYQGKAFERPGENKCVDSPYCKPVLVCRSSTSDLEGMDVIIRENRRYPEVPAGRTLDLNFYLQTLPDAMSFTRQDQALRLASYFDAEGTMRFATASAPRFDHDPETKEFLGLLIEGRSTNYALDSEDLTRYGSGTVLADTVRAPDGATSADAISAEALLAKPLSRVFAGLAARASTWTLSAFVKVEGAASISPELELTFVSGATATAATVQLRRDGGDSVTGSANAQYGMMKLPNGWYRISVTAANSAAADVRVTLGARGTGAAGDKVSFWGIQFEEGFFATSYVPTQSAPATREQDMASLQSGSWLSSRAGTFLFEWRLNGIARGKDQHLLVAENHSLVVEKSTGAFFHVMLMKSDTVPLITVSPRTFYRSAVSYDGGMLKAFQDGKAPTASPLLAGVDLGSGLLVGRDPVQNEPLYGHIRRISYWPAALTAGQLTDMTQPGRYSTPYSATLSTGEGIADPYIRTETTLFSVRQLPNAESFVSDVFAFSLALRGSQARVRVLLPNGEQDRLMQCQAIGTR